LSPWRLEYRVKFDGGTVRWLFGDALPEREADGSTLWHGFITDITERKQAEAIFHGLFDQSSFLAGILDQHGRLVDVNNTALLFTDTPREDLIGKYFPDTPWWNNAQDRGKLIEVLNLAYEGTRASFEATHTIPTGGHIDVIFSAMPIKLENGLYVAVVGIDITERKQAEEKLRISEEWLNLITSSAHNGIIMLDEAGNIAFWNQAKGYSGAPGKRLSGAICTICLLPRASGKHTFGPSRIFSKPVRELPSARHLSLPGCARTKASSLWSYHSPQCRLKTPGIDRYTA
jgi:PAS domain S-box-containing protein